jgi:hypothetical protein
LREKFPKFSDAKLKEGIFIEGKIREIINDDLFEHLLMETEKSLWLMFKAVGIYFLGNVTAKNTRIFSIMIQQMHFYIIKH